MIGVSIAPEVPHCKACTGTARQVESSCDVRLKRSHRQALLTTWHSSCLPNYLEWPQTGHNIACNAVAHPRAMAWFKHLLKQVSSSIVLQPGSSQSLRRRPSYSSSRD